MIREINPKRLMASAVIFVFTNLASPMLAEAPVVVATSPVTQEQVIEASSQVQVHVPRVISLAEQHVVIQAVTIPPFLLEDLSSNLFHFQNNVQVTKEGYADEKGAYVNTHPTDMQTSLVQLLNAENTLEKNLHQLLASPSDFSLRSETVSPFFGPKIVFDQKTSSYFLLFEPYDFRFVEKPMYDKKALGQTFVSVYGAFQGFHQSIKEKDIHIHTGFWGKDYHHNEKVSMALQLLAGSLTQVHLTFHIGDQEPSFQEAAAFVQEQSGVNVHDFLDRLMYKTVDPSWQAKKI